MCVAEVEIEPLLRAERVSHYYGARIGCKEISFDLRPGEVIGIVGESGSGKTTLLNCLCGHLQPSQGEVWYYGHEIPVEMHRAPEALRRRIMRTQMGVVYQNARDGLRMHISAGGNIGERLMANGARHYGKIRAAALHWLERVEIDTQRIDDAPASFSGGMQQRLQIARNLVTHPRLVFMDEPTSGLDVSVQARLLDILRNLVTELRLSMVVVTHDLAVARLLAHRLMVMRWEQGGGMRSYRSDPRRSATRLHPVVGLFHLATLGAMTMDWVLKIENLRKSFCLHTQGCACIPVLDNFDLTLFPGESLALTGPSGAGKSTLLKLLYGNYKIESGNVMVRHRARTVDLGQAKSHEILEIRKWTVGYVSQFLRVIPRVPCLQIVMEPLRARGVGPDEARRRAEALQ